MTSTKTSSLRAAWLAVVVAIATAACALACAMPAQAHASSYIWQTGRTTATANFSWDLTSMFSNPSSITIQSMEVKLGSSYSDMRSLGYITPSMTGSNYIKDMNPGTEARLEIDYTYTSGGYGPYSSYVSTTIYTTPGKPTNVKVASRNAGSYSLVVNATSHSASNYVYHEVKIKNLASGKTRTEHSSSSVYFSNPTNAVYSIRVRDYITDYNTNKKLYSAWSATKYYVCQPEVKSKLKSYTTSSFTIAWNKVSGAKNYKIYASTKNGSYKKVATVSSSKRSYKITKVKGKRVKVNKYYYVYVVATKKINGTTYTSPKTSKNKIRIYYY